MAMDNLEFSQKAHDYQRIEKAIRFLESHFLEQPGLDEMAAAVNLSKFHFQRLFKRWAGVTPTQFLHVLTLNYTKKQLEESRNLLDASLDAGLSGPGRLHDLFVTLEAVTPGEFKKKGAGIKIEYGFHPTPFGKCLLAHTARGICHLSFVADDEPEKALEALCQSWPCAVLNENRSAAVAMIGGIFSGGEKHPAQPFHLFLKGTNFQFQVWRALLSLPRGKVFSYQDIAAFIGRPTAVRATAHAIALNPVAYLIPCHRVISSSGVIHRYRWGNARKKAMIAWEAF